MPGARPSVSVVVPFYGNEARARSTLAAMQRLELGPQDELVIADNTPEGILAALPEAAGVTIERATAEQSPSHARNVGCARAGGEWLLFIDADCLAPPDLLDRYLRPPPPAECGALAGEVTSAAPDSLITRHADLRGYLSQRAHVEDAYRPRAVTANLLVRREAWASVGGFVEGVRTAEDADFCFRIQDAGWELHYREVAAVGHEHRDSLRSMLEQRFAYGAGAAWLNRRHPGAAPVPEVGRTLVRFLPSLAAFVVTGRFERAAFKLVDLAVLGCDIAGRAASNRSLRPPTAPPGASELAVVDGAGTTTLSSAAHREARQRPVRLAPRDERIAWREDDGWLERMRATARLLLRNGRALGADRRARRPGDTPLQELAPVAERLRMARGATLVHDPESRRDAVRLGRLIGASRVEALPD